MVLWPLGSVGLFWYTSRTEQTASPNFTRLGGPVLTLCPLAKYLLAIKSLTLRVRRRWHTLTEVTFYQSQQRSPFQTEHTSFHFSLPHGQTLIRIILKSQSIFVMIPHNTVCFMMNYKTASRRDHNGSLYNLKIALWSYKGAVHGIAMQNSTSKEMGKYVNYLYFQWKYK